MILFSLRNRLHPGRSALVAPALLIGLCLISRVGLTAEAPFRVAAASDLRGIFEEVVKCFERSHADRAAGVLIDVTYGSSGALEQQIENGAPFDIFLGADTSYTERLQEKNLVVGTNFHYATGQLVLWIAAKALKPKPATGLHSLTLPGVKRIAIANPVQAPFGKLAEKLLKDAGLYDRLKSQLVFGESVAQAAQFARAGAVDAALISRSVSTVLSPSPESLGSAANLKQTGAVLVHAKESRRLPLAESLRDFLLSEESQYLFSRHGLKKD